MLPDHSAQHKSNLQSYFDGVGFDRWSAIYGGEEDLSYVRRMVQQGHDRMLGTAIRWLQDRCAGGSLLDAGCGTGLFSLAMATRGFQVMGVDIAPNMVNEAKRHAKRAGLERDAIFVAGDLATVAGTYDAVACFDVLVHYPAGMFETMCETLAQKSNNTLLLTYAPYNRMLATLHWIGGKFPQGNRRTEIQMIRDDVVEKTLAQCGMTVQRREVINQGFYHVKLIEAVRV
ncbi:MAG: magnesium protoporphyrin IX methyltransferase [Chloroflexota bacterium]